MGEGEEMKLGDAVHTALSSFGITPERVSRWLATDDCGCGERRDKLNELDTAIRQAAGKPVAYVKRLFNSLLGTYDEQANETSGQHTEPVKTPGHAAQ